MAALPDVGCHGYNNKIINMWAVPRGLPTFVAMVTDSHVLGGFNKILSFGLGTVKCFLNVRLNLSSWLHQ